MALTQTQAAPVDPRERYTTLDVLRGFALFGVFLANFVWFADSMMATDEQMRALPTSGIDGDIRLILTWLVDDKANTLFAFLFGVGFSIQMQRLSARGRDFKRIYLRRLTILFGLGMIHLVFVFPWDILHLYALVGFILFALRNTRDHLLLWIGIPLLILGRPIIGLIGSAVGSNDFSGAEPFIGNSGALARQALDAAGDYWGLVYNFLGYRWFNSILSGTFLGWILYVLGRFMIGHWVGRRDYLTHPERHQVLLRRVLFLTLPAGLVVSGIYTWLEASGHPEWLQALTVGEWIGNRIHFIATPLLACGYVCAILVALQLNFPRRFLMPLSAVGRMALTNYLVQSFVLAFALYEFGPGLGLAGRLGALTSTVIVIVGFAVQVAYSYWWLARFRFGPAEWLWRALTYGTLPPIRVTVEADSAAPEAEEYRIGR